MRIGIIIAASRFLPYHSVFQVVKEQIEMIHAAGHVPVLIAPRNLEWNGAPEYAAIRPILPLYKPVKYLRRADLSPEHLRTAQDTASILIQHCAGLDMVFTHDIIYLDRLLPLAQGLRLAIQELPDRPRLWLHWIHSIPGEPRDFWTLPPRSLLVHPNEAHRMLCADRFGVRSEDVLCVPHARDPRSCLFRTDLVLWMADALDLLQADFVQTYPVSTGRMQGKGLHQIIGVFSALHDLGHSIRLIVANSPSDSSDTKRVESFMKYALQSGLPEGSLVFSSALNPPPAVVREEESCLS
ncbi:MAG: hypothetical protein ACE5ID_12085, partial [Acidobacteriota bacterium]